MKHTARSNFCGGVNGFRSGFTMVELFFALTITALVMSALSAFSIAMATAWQRHDEVDSLTLRARQASVRVAEQVRDARLIAFCSAGALDGTATPTACVLIWKDDTNNDGMIQGAELTMIEHNAVTHELRHYPVGQGNTATVLNWATVSDPGIVVEFRKGRVSVPLVRGAYGALFAVTSATSATQGPTLEFAVKFRHEKRDSSNALVPMGDGYTDYGTAVVRAPLPVPS
jgi:Tfp pilus assembly protein PilW